METIVFKGRRVEVPGVVDECSGEQYRRLLQAMVEHSWGVIDADGLKASAMSTLLGVHDIRDYRPEITEEVMGQAGKITGILEGTTLKLESCRNMLPELSGWKARSGDMFNGLTFGQWLTAYTHFRLAMREGIGEEERTAHYSGLGRAMYLPPGTTEPGDRGGDGIAANGTGELDPPVMLVTHCMLHFAAVWHAINTQPIEIAGEEIDFRIIFKAGGGRAQLDDKTGWAGLAMEVAKDGPFGTLDGVNGADFWDVMLYLYKVKFEFIHRKRAT